MTRHVLAKHTNKEAILQRDVSDGMWKEAITANVIYKVQNGLCKEGLCLTCGRYLHKLEDADTTPFDEHKCPEKQNRVRSIVLPDGRKIKKPAMTLTGDHLRPLYHATGGMVRLEHHDVKEKTQIHVEKTFKNLADTTVALYKENKALKEKAKVAVVAETVDPGPTLWKAMREAEIPGFEEEERDSDDDTPLPTQDVPTIVSTISRQFQAFRKALAGKEAQVKRRFDADIAAQKAELEEQDKKLAEQARLIVDQEETIASLERKLKDKEATIQALLAALRQKSTAPVPATVPVPVPVAADSESDSDTETPTIEVHEVEPPIRKRVMMKSLPVQSEHRTKLTQMNLV
jgi:hypothetical protein